MKILIYHADLMHDIKKKEKEKKNTKRKQQESFTRYFN